MSSIAVIKISQKLEKLGKFKLANFICNRTNDASKVRVHYVMNCSKIRTCRCVQSNKQILLDCWANEQEEV